jgi:hypothetical protein
MHRAAVLGINCVVLLLCAPTARADIAVPDPPTVWSRGQEPSGNTVVAAGAALSAVIVAAGLVMGRWPVKSSMGRFVVAAVAGVTLLAVWGAAAGAIWQADRDRGLWRQWEIDESNRRANWRPPPQFDGSLEPSPPSSLTPESSASARPTSAAESVQ